jgi:putative endonuclease
VKKFGVPAIAGIFEKIRRIRFGGNHTNRLKAGLQTDSEAPHLRAGRSGEAQAEKFLKKAGLKIIARNVRVGYDELDLIAKQGDTLIFVEVKTRANENFGRPAAAVNRAKRKKLSRAAIHFLKNRKLRPPYIRFDVVEVIGDKPEIRHIQNAFTLEGGYRIWW